MRFIDWLAVSIVLTFCVCLLALFARAMWDAANWRGVVVFLVLAAVVWAGYHVAFIAADRLGGM